MPAAGRTLAPVFLTLAAVTIGIEMSDPVSDACAFTAEITPVSTVVVAEGVLRLDALHLAVGLVLGGVEERAHHDARRQV